MASANSIGIVTVTYNSGDVLAAFLRCLMAQTHTEFIVFVIDNASTDDTLTMLSACSDPRLRITTNPDNRGVAAGNNQGILAAREANCVSVLLLNNDTEFDTTLLALLDEELDKKQAGMVCPKMLYYHDPKRIWTAGGKFIPLLGYTSVHIGEGQLDRGQYDQDRLVTYVPTCCVLIHREVFDVVGLMDERYFVYSDDTDFMYRAMVAGVKIMYLHNAKLLHKVGQLTGGEDSPFALTYGTRNRIIFQLKHFGLLRTLPWLLARQILWLLALASRRKTFAWYRRKNAAFRSGLRIGREITR